jgi:hypothetical protein
MMMAAAFLRAAANSADSARELAEGSSTPVREERGGNFSGSNCKFNALVLENSLEDEGIEFTI